MRQKRGSPSEQGIIDITSARKLVNEYLRKAEDEMRFFGSGLPDYKEPDVNLVIVAEQEFDFGWMFNYNTKKYVESGDMFQCLLGNVPLFVDRMDGHLYLAGIGSGCPMEEHIKTFRRGDLRQRVD